MTNGNGSNTTDVWKWIAALLATILLAGSPGIVLALRSPSSADVELIRERQQEVLQRLAAIEVRLDQLDQRMSALESQLDEHLQQQQGNP